MNETVFHEPSRASYEFIADRVLEIDQFNPQVAARLVSTFNQWRRYEPQRRDQMRKQLQRIVDTAGLSENTYEIASKALANPG